jgi:hypothetical protein
MAPAALGRRGVVENAIEIEAQPEAVFDYCTDVLREPEWNPKLLEVEKLTEGPIGLGTRFKIRLDGVGWSTTENIAFERPKYWAATSASRLLDVRIEFEVDTNGPRRPAFRADSSPAAWRPASRPTYSPAVHAGTVGTPPPEDQSET